MSLGLDYNVICFTMVSIRVEVHLSNATYENNGEIVNLTIYGLSRALMYSYVFALNHNKLCRLNKNK